MYGALALDNYGALALDNPNYDRRAGRNARGTEARHLKIKAIRAKYRDRNKDWYLDPVTKAEYRAELDADGLQVFGSDQSGNPLFDVTKKTASTSARRKQIGKAKRAFKKRFATGRRTKAKAFMTRAKMMLKGKTARKDLTVTKIFGQEDTIVGARKSDGTIFPVGSTIREGQQYFQLVSNIQNQRRYNDARQQRKAGLAYFTPATAANNPRHARHNPPGSYGQYAGGDYTYRKPNATGTVGTDRFPKASGMLVDAFKEGNYQAIMVPDGNVVMALSGESLGYGKKKRKSKKSKGSGTGKKLTEAQKAAMKAGGVAYRAEYAKQKAANPGSSAKELHKLTKQARKAAKSNPRRKPPVGSKAYYRAKHRMANKNPMGALALDNYGALALDNGIVDDVKSSALSSGKLIGFGLVGAVAHALVGEQIEDIVEQIPVIGEKAYGLEVPEAVPVIGGMELDHTITGLVAGVALITAGGLAKGRLNIPVLGDIGSILMAVGAGAAAVGPAMDVTKFISEDDGEDDMGALALDNYGGLALENYGGLALDNEGTFGDGMAYQIGQIAESNDSTEFEQASLADANYSGADFDLGEGEALINGRKHFFRRYGHPTRRIHTPGSSMATSHLAGQPGHRWGWLIKMIGWGNTQKLAAMSPSQRVSTIKQLRANALQTFQQIQAQQAELSAAAIAPELGAMGPEGVSGAFGSYGSTLFSGEGL